MTGERTRRGVLGLGALGLSALAGCGGSTPTTDGTTGTPGTDTPEPSSQGSEGTDGEPPAFARFAPAAMADTEVELGHLSLPDFRAAEPSLPSDVASVVSQDFRQLASTIGVDFEAVNEGARISGGVTLCVGDFGTDDATLPPEGDDREYATETYGEYDLFVADGRKFAIRDGVAVFCRAGTSFLKQVLDAGASAQNRLGSRVDDFPTTFGTPSELSYGILSLGAVALPFQEVPTDDVERWGRGWQFGDSRTELVEGVLFASADAAATAEIRPAVDGMGYYEQYDEISIEGDGRVVRITGTVANGDFMPFPGY